MLTEYSMIKSSIMHLAGLGRQADQSGQPLAYLNYLIDLFREATGPLQIGSDRYRFPHMDDMAWIHH